MGGIEVLRTIMATNDMVVNTLLSDLSDGDLLARPTPKANHIAWQLGHLMLSEIGIVRQIVPDATYPDLPPGFSELHDKAGADKDQGFLTKAEYLDLYSKIRAATQAVLNRMSDADLDKPNEGRMKQWFPTWGGMMTLAANHPMMHAGQFGVVRRCLGKPVLI